MRTSAYIQVSTFQKSKWSIKTAKQQKCYDNYSFLDVIPFSVKAIPKLNDVVWTVDSINLPSKA